MSTCLTISIAFGRGIAVTRCEEQAYDADGSRFPLMNSKQMRDAVARKANLAISKIAIVLLTLPSVLSV